MTHLNWPLALGMSLVLALPAAGTRSFASTEDPPARDRRATMFRSIEAMQKALDESTRRNAELQEELRALRHELEANHDHDRSSGRPAPKRFGEFPKGRESDVASHATRGGRPEARRDWRGPGPRRSDDDRPSRDRADEPRDRSHRGPAKGR